jgi:hypothetical protein
MSVAKIVAEIDPKKLEWLNIEDEHGATWRYARRDQVASDVLPHVQARSFGTSSTIRAVLVRGRDGTPFLRQDGQGLPKRIVVDCATPGGRSLGMAAYRQGKVEYERD